MTFLHSEWDFWVELNCSLTSTPSLASLLHDFIAFLHLRFMILVWKTLIVLEFMLLYFLKPQTTFLNSRFLFWESITCYYSYGFRTSWLIKTLVNICFFRFHILWAMCFLTLFCFCLTTKFSPKNTLVSKLLVCTSFPSLSLALVIFWPIMKKVLQITITLLARL